jgi:RNA binding exosome subunit
MRAEPRSLEISAIVHATEDEGKVIRALMNALPEAAARGLSIRKGRYSGHHGNPITFLRAHLRGNHPREALRHVLSRLPDGDRGALYSGLGAHIDEGGNLYIRLDKQRAYLNELRLSQADPIRLKWAFKVDRDEGVEEGIRRACMELVP